MSRKSLIISMVLIGFLFSGGFVLPRMAYAIADWPAGDGAQAFNNDDLVAGVGEGEPDSVIKTYPACWDGLTQCYGDSDNDDLVKGELRGYLLIPSGSSGNIKYQVVDMGYGNEADTRSYAVKINNNGQILVTSSIGQPSYTKPELFHPFLYENGVKTPLGNGRADCINDQGTIVGHEHPKNFMFENGVKTYFSPTLDNTFVTNINNAGLIAGYNPVGPPKGTYILNNQIPNYIGGDFPVAINEAGAIVGPNAGFLYLYENGMMKNIIEANPYSMDINNNRQIVGSTKSWVVFLWENDFIDYLGTFGSRSVPEAINDNEVIVGHGEVSPDNRHAFIYTDGAFTDLNNLIPPNSGWTLRYASDINNSGWIIGAGDYKPHKHLKWSQPPLEILEYSWDGEFYRSPVYCGWNERSYMSPGWTVIDDPWFDCWDFPYQCYGDANGDDEVTSADTNILFDAFGGTYPDSRYNPCADFNHDLKVGIEDELILVKYEGVDLEGYDICPGQQSYTEPETWHMAADDFRCFGSMPVTSVHWWGSYQGWWWGRQDVKDPPEDLSYQPPIIGWRIGFWSNVRAGENYPDITYSYPEKMLWQVDVSADKVVSKYEGDDYFRSDSGEIWENCYKYYLKLDVDDYFWQEQYLNETQDDVFWISITAIYPEVEPGTQFDLPYPWGWKTRPAHWMDDAVRFELTEQEPEVGTLIEPWKVQVSPLESNKFCTYGESYDLAFELDTDPEFIKWEQPFTGIRDWSEYKDEESMIIVSDGQLVHRSIMADDWMCQRRTPVSSIVWWGSYLGYNYAPCNRQFCTQSPDGPDYFLIKIWTDVAVDDPANQLGFSYPGNEIWQYKAMSYDEVLVGYDQSVDPFGGIPDEPVFRYSVKLPEDKWFCQREVDGIYWISIQAVYVDRDPEYAWGWTNHPYVFQDIAIRGYPGSSPADPDEWYWDIGAETDMSFMLFTDPQECCSCADFNSDNIVNLLDFNRVAANWLWSGSPGGYNIADLNCDGDVKLADLSIFVSQWLSSCP